MSQLDTPFSVLSCRNCFDFVDMLVLKCFFLLCYILAFSFMNLFLIFLMGSSAIVYSFCCLEIRLGVLHFSLFMKNWDC